MIIAFIGIIAFFFRRRKRKLMKALMIAAILFGAAITPMVSMAADNTGAPKSVRLPVTMQGSDGTIAIEKLDNSSITVQRDKETIKANETAQITFEYHEVGGGMFQVSQVKRANGSEYDQSVYDVVIQVTENTKGELVSTIILVKDDNKTKPSEMVFKNPEPPTKEVIVTTEEETSEETEEESQEESTKKISSRTVKEVDNSDPGTDPGGSDKNANGTTQTGDRSGIWLYFVVCCAASVVFLLLAVNRRKQNNHDGDRK
jgi:pilin isopeptide linkage protein